MPEAQSQPIVAISVCAPQGNGLFSLLVLVDQLLYQKSRTACLAKALDMPDDDYWAIVANRCGHWSTAQACSPVLLQDTST